MLSNDNNSTSGVVSQGNNASNVLNATTASSRELVSAQKTNTLNRLPANSLFRGDQVGVKCPMCLEPFCNPKVLACFHSFCKSCLERQLVERELSEAKNPALREQRRKHRQAHLHQHRNNGEEDDDPPGQILVCLLCHVETQLSFQLGIDGLLSDYGLMNAVNAKQRLSTNNLSNDEKNGMLIFGSPSSTSSSPALDDVCNQVDFFLFYMFNFFNFRMLTEVEHNHQLHVHVVKVMN